MSRFGASLLLILCWSTVPAAGYFLGAQKVTKNALKPMVSVFLYSSRFLNAAAIHGKLFGNQVMASVSDRFFPS